MGRLMTGLAGFAVATVATPVVAQQAQMQCDTRPSVITQLATRYSEAPVAMGLANNGGVVEVLTNKAGESWSIIITLPNGMSCMMASGRGWESMPGTLASTEPGA